MGLVKFVDCAASDSVLSVEAERDERKGDD